MATIKVRGRGSVAVRPDEAVVTFEGVSTGDGPAEAFSTTAGPANALGAAAEACRRAIADASSRADAYAGALRSRVGRVETVEEVPAGEPAAAGAVYARAVAAEAPPLYPAELLVSAVVDVVFALEPA